MRTPSLWIKIQTRALTKLPDELFNMILKFMAGPGALTESCLTWHECPGGMTAIPGLVKEMQLVRRQHMITVSDFTSEKESELSPKLLTSVEVGLGRDTG